MDQSNRTAGSKELQEYLATHQDDLLTHIVQFNELMRQYQAATKEITTKLEILQGDFVSHSGRSCIETITCRLKTPSSIIKKLERKGIPPSLEALRTQLNDIAGVRVICPFLDDIYMVAQTLARQDDIQVLSVKDYIAQPKPNGYRSYHIIVQVPVFFCEKKEAMRVEIQLRTVAMDFWATLEHQMKYKNASADSAALVDALRSCADTIAATDQRMLQLRGYISRHQRPDEG